MSDAAVERLAKLITEDASRKAGGGDRAPQRRLMSIHWHLEEGWFSLFLLATVVYSTIWSVQAARWVEHLDVLTLTTLVGLVIGLVAAKQQRLPRLLVHALVVVFGIVFAYWQTAGSYYKGNLVDLWTGLSRWYVVLLNNGSSDDNAIFHLLILALGYVLAYTSAWLLYRTRSPWLMIGANAVVLLINLSALSDGHIVFLVVFLVAALLLLLRFNLVESLKRWRRQGLRYSDDLSWDVMQGGALISIGILILSWVLPSGYMDPTAAQVWNLDSNPVVQAQNIWNRMIAVNAGVNSPSNNGNFRDTLTLGGNPNLNKELVLTFQADDDLHYLQILNYETYGDTHQWETESPFKISLKANQAQPTGELMVKTVKQNYAIVNPPGLQKPYLIGMSQPISMSVAADVLFNSNAQATGWLGTYGKLAAGQKYSVVSSVSQADILTLRAVPMPDKSPSIAPDSEVELPPTYFAPGIVKAYTQLPRNLDPQINRLAKSIADSQGTMYEKAVALENYLRNNYNYSVDINKPAGEEGVSWFLFRSGNKGFCNYFASAMVLMARSLGIPARVAVGYTNGALDEKTHIRSVYGSDAHAWVQIYFARYGWINFEPSASFPTFSRPITAPNSTGNSEDPSTAGNTQQGNLPIGIRNEIGDEQSGGGNSSGGADAIVWQRTTNITLGSLVVLVLFGILFFGVWWQRLFRRYGLPARVYGRLCVMANWAGIKLEPSQTPTERMQEFALALPLEEKAFTRVGDIYVRDLWADPRSDEHPRRTGEINEMPGLWKDLQPRIFAYVLKHPHFLRWLPERVFGLVGLLLKKRKSRKQKLEDGDL
jgi:transglutaminase-like putative cysteine protease